MESVDALITIDFREHDLIETFRDNGASGQLVKCLPLADVQCDYANGTGWLLERKTAFDFAASIRDGRFFEQRSRLTNATGFLVFFVIEGDMRQSTMHPHMLSAMIGVKCRDQVHIFRTWTIRETFDLICVLVRKLQSQFVSAEPIPSGIVPPKMIISKRKRESSPTIVYKRMLMCIPSISEGIADKLVSEYDTLPSLQRALVTGASLRHIVLAHDKRIGKARLNILKQYLLDPSSGCAD